MTDQQMMRPVDGIQATPLALMTAAALVAFAASLAARASEEVEDAQQITMPGSRPSGPFGTGVRVPDFALPDLDWN